MTLASSLIFVNFSKFELNSLNFTSHMFLLQEEFLLTSRGLLSFRNVKTAFRFPVASNSIYHIFWNFWGHLVPLTELLFSFPENFKLKFKFSHLNFGSCEKLNYQWQNYGLCTRLFDLQSETRRNFMNKDEFVYE